MVGELPAPATPPRFAIASKGFRPFFLLAALFATAIVPVWLLVLGGAVRAGGYFDATAWHAHEMVFGFAVAVIAGFLLTAVGNWTQRETAIGAPLLALAALWIAGRAAVLVGATLPRGVPLIVDGAFLPALAAVLARPLVAAKSRRNFVMLGLLGVLCAANVVAHLGALGVLSPGAARHASLVGVDVVVLVILVMAGRVFPMFTRNATGVASIRSRPYLDVATIAGMAVVTVLDAAAPSAKALAAVCAVVGVLAVARAWSWGARPALRQSILWILHAGHAWVAVGLFARALAVLDPAIPASAGVHAWTVGAIGATTLGMMARVSLGHSGRPIRPAPAVAWAFVAVTGAAVARVAVPIVAPAWTFPGLIAAGSLWTIAFAIYVLVYAPILMSPRADGRPG
jgi:uncharacterized protein involved in response to NO